MRWTEELETEPPLHVYPAALGAGLQHPRTGSADFSAQHQLVDSFGAMNLMSLLQLLISVAAAQKHPGLYGVCVLVVAVAAGEAGLAHSCDL